MVALTKAQAKVALDHIMDHLFELDKDSAMVKAFVKDGVNDIRDVLAMDYEHYAMLKYVDDNGDNILIPLWQQALLKVLKNYNWWRYTTLQCPVDDWTTVTKDDFDDYRLGPNYQTASGPVVVKPFAATTTSTARMTPKDMIGDINSEAAKPTGVIGDFKSEAAIKEKHGISKDIGPVMKFPVLNDCTNQVILCTACDPSIANPELDKFLTVSSTGPPVLQFCGDNLAWTTTPDHGEIDSATIPVIDFNEDAGHTNHVRSTSKDIDWKDSTWNTMIEWTNGETASETLADELHKYKAFKHVSCNVPSPPRFKQNWMHRVIDCKQDGMDKKSSVFDDINGWNAKLHNHDIALSFHHDYGGMALHSWKVKPFPQEYHPIDLMYKHWGYHQYWSMLKAIPFYQGKTMDLIAADGF